MEDMQDQSSLRKIINERRDILNKRVLKGINDEVIILSQELDILIEKYMKNQLKEYNK